MKNIKKTVAAGVIGVTLLAAIPGTFATWQHSNSASAGTITTGDMEVVQVKTQSPGLIRNGKIVARGDHGTAFGGLTLVPGDSVINNLTADIALTGLTLADVRITSAYNGDLEFTTDGFLKIGEKVTDLRFSIDPRTPSNLGDPGQHRTVGVLRVDFVRSNEKTGMYSNDIDFDLGPITVTVTQK